MLDNFIKEKVDLVSYSQIEISNIANTLSNLKNIINNERDYREPFLGGSYKRATMVKGVSDVDVYFRYVGISNPQSALAILKSCLIKSYPNTSIKQDKPSILIEFQKIPMNITPYKQDYMGNLSIPDSNLQYWQTMNFGELEQNIVNLRRQNSKLIDLIKILKLWNFNHRKGIKNFEIEKKVCSLFLNRYIVSYSLPDLMLTFFNNNGFQNDATKLRSLMLNNSFNLKTEWLKFINNN
jgi:hypothetical protein